MMRRISWVTLILIMIFMYGCNTRPVETVSPDAGESTETSEPAEVATPEAGKSTVVGQLRDLDSDKPLANQFVRLAEVIRQQGQELYVLDIGFSPVDTSDANGIFIVVNIPPGDYVIIVGDVATSLQRVEKDGALVVFTALTDQILDVGIIRVMKP